MKPDPAPLRAVTSVCRMETKTTRLILFFTVAFFLLGAGPAELCIFKNESGTIVQTRGRDLVPERFRADATCLPLVESQSMAKPEEVKLEGNIRRLSMSSSVGRIELRWPRTAESLFGRTPERAMADAAQTVSRFIKTKGFPVELQTLDLPWQVVFMDEKVPEAQIPMQLISNCHPAWMTPIANLYVVAQRVAAGCTGQRPGASGVADSQLTQVLLHEMGHAVEFQLLKNSGNFDRMRAEGFATWFMLASAKLSHVVNLSQTQREYDYLAQQSLKESPGVFTFQGTGFDYARASLYFQLVEKKQGVPGVMDLYESIVSKGLSFQQAVSATLHLKPEQVEIELKKLVKIK